MWVYTQHKLRATWSTTTAFQNSTPPRPMMSKLPPQCPLCPQREGCLWGRCDWGIPPPPHASPPPWDSWESQGGGVWASSWEARCLWRESGLWQRSLLLSKVLKLDKWKNTYNVLSCGFLLGRLPSIPKAPLCLY